MTTLNTMLTNRDTAGARYLAAAQELRAAYVDLAAIDQALSNSLYGIKDPFQRPVQSFDGTQAQQGLPHGLEHPVYCGPSAIAGAWDKDADAQGAVYLAALKAG